MRRKILASLLLAGALSGLYRLGAQTPEPVALTVRPTESKDLHSSKSTAMSTR